MTGCGDDVHYRGDEVEGDDTVESIILVFRFFHLVLHFLKSGYLSWQFVLRETDCGSQSVSLGADRRVDRDPANRTFSVKGISVVIDKLSVYPCVCQLI